MNELILRDYNIHICRKVELAELINFIHNHWKRDHILALCPELMDWQHYDRGSNSYNFVIAKNMITNEIHAILGFIPVSHFDVSLKQYNDFWQVMWKVRDDVRAPGLGVSLISFLWELKKPRFVSVFGLSPMVVPMYREMGFKTGILTQYYIVNKDKLNFNLIGDFNGKYSSGFGNGGEGKEFIKYDKNNFSELAARFKYVQPEKQLPRKSLTYLYNRYIAHPIYDYHMYAIAEKKELIAVFVSRLVNYQSNRALRIVDYYGSADGLIESFTAFQTLLSEYEAEYIDFYNLGIGERALFNAGFIKRPQTGKVVIPNYFEPFKKNNVNLDFAYKANAKFEHFIFKGDCDQDRPNQC